MSLFDLACITRSEMARPSRFCWNDTLSIHGQEDIVARAFSKRQQDPVFLTGQASLYDRLALVPGYVVLNSSRHAFVQQNPH